MYIIESAPRRCQGGNEVTRRSGRAFDWFDWLFCHRILFHVAAKAWYDGTSYVWLVQLSAHTVSNGRLPSLGCIKINLHLYL